MWIKITCQKINDRAKRNSLILKTSGTRNCEYSTSLTTVGLLAMIHASFCSTPKVAKLHVGWEVRKEDKGKAKNVWCQWNNFDIYLSLAISVSMSGLNLDYSTSKSSAIFT